MTTRSAEPGAGSAAGRRHPSGDRRPAPACPQACGSRTGGHVYAVLTAVLCPCHMPVWGALLGGTAAGLFFERHFWMLAAVLGALTLWSFAKAARVLL